MTETIDIDAQVEPLCTRTDDKIEVKIKKLRSFEIWKGYEEEHRHNYDLSCSYVLPKIVRRWAGISLGRVELEIRW